MNRVLVTGIGAISSIGLDVDQNFHSLSEELPGLNGKGLEYSQLSHLRTAAVNKSNSQLADLARVDARSQIWSRTDLLGIIAASECVSRAGLSSKDLKGAALISATTVGGMDIYEQYHEAIRKNLKPESELFSYDCADSTEKIADQLGIKQLVTSISTACSSSANAILLGSRLIKAKKVAMAVVGGTEALSRFTLNGFNSLKILDEDRCRPFDRDRKGLNLGEGAAYLVLESEDSANKRGASVLAEILGYANENDAYHQTASSPDGGGAYSAMLKALEMSGCKAEEVDYINAHGTGTANNDLSESHAIQRLFGDRIPPFSSTKSFTGHTLATAGSLEAVFSILTLTRGRAFSNLRFSNAIPETGLVPLTASLTGEFKRVLSNSFGFGGNSTSLLIGNA